MGIVRVKKKTAIMGNSMEILQKLKENYHMIQSNLNFWVFILKMNLVTQRYWTPIFIVAIITTVKIWKQSKHKRMNGLKKCQTHTLTHIHTHSCVEYSVQFSHSTLKKKEILPLVTDGSTWRTLYWGNMPDTERQVLHDSLMCRIK